MTRTSILCLGLTLTITACGEDPDSTDKSAVTADPPVDADSDGHPVETDCDDENPDVHPDAEETPYDGVDNDCDESTLDDDLDGDGFLADEDCDDSDPSINPGRSEICDNVDNDCSGVVDDNAGAEWFQDSDGDGYGDPNQSVMQCDGANGYVANSDDCDDGIDTIYPGADELCNGLDDDCDGDTDEAGAVDAPTYYRDLDRDGYGDIFETTHSCDQPPGYTDNHDDCDDTTATVNPAAEELCDAIDNDCDGYVDEDGASGGSSWYLDTDGDGYGDADATVVSCAQPAGTTTDATDCDDSDSSINPGATETWYDGIDSDCASDDDYDADADGDRSEVWGGSDCDESDATVHSAATEVWYDGVDQDCDGRSDYDADLDTYDSDAWSGTDCDDTSSTVYPGAPEVDGGIDNDCDGQVEEMPTASPSYDSLSSLEHCTPLQLDGSASIDPDGTSLTYEWELTSAPSSSTRTTADIVATTDESPVFYPDIVGDYTFTLTVEDEDGTASTPSSSTITIASRTTNETPVASAGDDVTLSSTASCTPISYGVSYDCEDCTATHTLDASATTDADDEPLRYSWSITSGTATLSNEHTTTPTLDLTSSASFGVATTNTIELEVEVTDCYGDTSTDSVTVTYECTGE